MDKVSCLFVCGTDTNVGKTVVTSALLQGLANRGYEPVYWKPVQTGTCQGTDGDTVRRLVPEAAHATTGFAYSDPLSPDQAAIEQGAPQTDVARLSAQLQELQASAKGNSFLVVEGAGGLLVPLNDQGETWCDFLEQTSLPTLVVGRSGLGTLNHSTLTLRHLESRGIPLAGLILSGDPHPLNERSLRHLVPNLKLTTLARIPELHLHPSWTKKCDDLADFILKTEPPEQTDWVNADAKHAWHPYTQHKTAEPPLAVEAARGIWLTTSNGQRLMDASSSWWVNSIGHGRPEISMAIASQQARLDHVLFAGATHAPGAMLARRVTSMAGSGLTRAFYSDNGSTAVEVGLKMVYQSWINRGQSGRNTFLAFRGSYHGDTFGAMAVAAADGFHGVFRPLLFETLRATPVTSHPSSVCPEGEAGFDDRMEEIERTLNRHQDALAGVIIEPLVQGAAGMLMQPPEFLQKLADLCRNYQLPLIFDEVFTGLSRIGAPFAFQRAGVTPDIVCVAKGLTGGNLPLAMTLAKEDFYESFLFEDKAKALLHGHSYTGNPIACRAALTCLDIMEREKLFEKGLAIEARYGEWIATHGAELGIEHARKMGGILAFELPGSGVGNYFDRRATLIPKLGKEEGLFLRPLGNTVYFMPPLVISDEDLTRGLDGLKKVVGTVGSMTP